MSRVQRRQSGL